MKFEDIKRLHEKKFREELKHFVIEGEHLVQELEKAAVRDARLRESKIFVTRDYANWSSKLPMHVIQSKHMAQISETRSPQGIAAVVPLLEPAAPRPGERAIYLHEIQDPGNFGTILRTLAWFGNFRCLVQSRQRGPAQRQGGARQHGRHLPRPRRVRRADGRVAKTFCAHRLAGSLRAADSSPAFREFDCYVFGNEARGLPREQMNALGARRSRSPEPAPSNLERRGDRQHLPVRAQSRFHVARDTRVSVAGKGCLIIVTGVHAGSLQPPCDRCRRGSTQSVTSMGEVIHVNFGEVHYSAELQGVLSKRIQARLLQRNPERWKRADRIAAQAIADMKSFDKRIECTLTIERPVAADGTFSEQAFLASTEKLKTEIHALVHELRKAAHLAIASTAYSTVIQVAAHDDMLPRLMPGPR